MDDAVAVARDGADGTRLGERDAPAPVEKLRELIDKRRILEVSGSATSGDPVQCGDIGGVCGTGSLPGIGIGE